MTVTVAESVTVVVTAPGHADTAPHRECRVRDCAGTTNRRCGASRTIALPGTPREARCGPAVPAQKEAAARKSSVVIDDPATYRVTTLLVRRWDTGTPIGVSVSQKAGSPGNRDKGKHLPPMEHPTISRIRDPSRFETEGHAGSIPLQWGPHTPSLRWVTGQRPADEDVPASGLIRHARTYGNITQCNSCLRNSRGRSEATFHVDS